MREATYAAARSLLDIEGADLAGLLRRLPARDVAEIGEAARTDWPTFARAKQCLPTGAWRWWAICAGRMFGKTRAAAEAVRQVAEAGRDEWVSIIAPTANNLLRDMLGGPSGLLTISPRWFMPSYLVQRNELRYPRHPITGIQTRVALLSADRPDRIRGSQCSLAWCDEPQSWTKAREAFEMVDLSLRLGPHPRGILTLTPKPTPFVRDLILGLRNAAGQRTPRPDMVVTRGATFENTAIAPEALESLRKTYEGTATAAQELEGAILEAPVGALWHHETLDKFRVAQVPPGTNIKRTIVSVDPSRSPDGLRDLCGIIVLGLGSDGHCYVFEDASTRGGPLQWARHAVSVAQRYNANAIVFEQNRLSVEIVSMIRQVSAGSEKQWKPITATAKKEIRAEPVAGLFAAGMVHLVGNGFEHLEAELCGWDPAQGFSPDRLDALVHGVTELQLGAQAPALAIRLESIPSNYMPSASRPDGWTPPKMRW